jgi:hypothetical protein
LTICQFVAFGDDVDLILLARELVSKQAARKMVLKIEVIRGDSARMVGYSEFGSRFADHSRLAAQLSVLAHAPSPATGRETAISEGGHTEVT